MASNKKSKKVKGKQKKVKDKASKKGFTKLYVFLVFGLIAAIVLLPTTFMLMFALLPSFVAFLVDRTARKMKALTVGAMNMAGCSPFLLELWLHGHDFAKAFEIITDPKAVIVIYCAAAVGYFIDWAMTGLVASFLMQRAKARKKAIEKRQKELVERWGKEVKGDVPLDAFGFPIENGLAVPAESSTDVEPKSKS